jgi:hypothetical protein
VDFRGNNLEILHISQYFAQKRPFYDVRSTHNSIFCSKCHRIRWCQILLSIYLSKNDKYILTFNNMLPYNECEITNRQKGIMGMWNADKSVVLSLICTKLVMLLVVVFAFVAPNIVDYYLGYTAAINSDIASDFLVTVYTCCVPALIALFCLDRLLTNIKRKEVFIEKNVRYLRWISWCCFVVSALILIGAFSTLLLFIVAIAAAFIGLILRVVKNVIEQAMIIKNENDLTI